eukprot:1158006-Pelagomonas_calceolata.AAC.11
MQSTCPEESPAQPLPGSSATAHTDVASYPYPTQKHFNAKKHAEKVCTHLSCTFSIENNIVQNCPVPLRRRPSTSGGVGRLSARDRDKDKFNERNREKDGTVISPSRVARLGAEGSQVAWPLRKDDTRQLHGGGSDGGRGSTPPLPPAHQLSSSRPSAVPSGVAHAGSLSLYCPKGVFQCLCSFHPQCPQEATHFADLQLSGTGLLVACYCMLAFLVT